MTIESIGEDLSEEGNINEMRAYAKAVGTVQQETSKHNYVQAEGFFTDFGVKNLTE